MKRAPALLSVIVLMTALAVAMPGYAGGNKYDPSTAVRDCGDSDTVTFDGPLKLWPPNHKFVPLSITATDGGEDGSDATTLEITPTVTDIAGGDGGTNHDPDVEFPSGNMASGDPSATVPVNLRAERSGRGEGRTYTLDWVATFDGGSKTCTSMDDGQSAFVVFVPHDMRGGRDW